MNCLPSGSSAALLGCVPNRANYLGYYVMLKQLSCFQFQRASFSDSSLQNSVVLFRPVPKYLGGEIYNRVVSSASLFFWSLHSGELAPQFGGISSTLLAGLFSTPFLVCLCLRHHQTHLSAS